MLRTKCIHAPISPEDGYRISVMSRHTDTTGKNYDYSIVPGVTYNEWNQQVPPPSHMVGLWYRVLRANPQAAIEEFWVKWANVYVAYLDQVQPQQVRNLARWAKLGTITLLCYEKEPWQCHRGLLASKIQQIDRSIEVEHVY